MTYHFYLKEFVNIIYSKNKNIIIIFRKYYSKIKKKNLNCSNGMLINFVNENICCVNTEEKSQESSQKQDINKKHHQLKTEFPHIYLLQKMPRD